MTLADSEIPVPQEDILYRQCFKTGDGKPWTDTFLIEKEMVQRGGYVTTGGKRYGNGPVYHFKRSVSALYPEFRWNPWADLIVEAFILDNEIGIVGPGSSGKTFVLAVFLYTYIQIWPKGTTILMSTTTKASLQLRNFSYISEIHNAATRIRKWLPGRLIMSRCALAFEDLEDEAQELKHGIIGVACRVGDTWVGLGNYVGIKNQRLLLCADEGHLMDSSFLRALANMRKSSKGARFKMIVMGNPKDTTDPLGMVCEPHVEDGGWEAYDPVPKTRKWRTRARGGVAIQLCGYDTPNGDAKKGEEPFPGIILKEDIENDAVYFGRESIDFTMMNLGVFPVNAIAKRVITVTLCEAHQAFEEVIWESSDQNHRAVGLDAAYSGIGGDRCVLTDLTWGLSRDGKTVMAYTSPPIIVPVTTKKGDPQPEDQIAKFCMNYCLERGIRPDQFGLDSTGKGTLVSALNRMWSTDVIPIEFGGKPTDRIVQEKDGKRASDAFGKFVTELWFSARRVIVACQMRMMPRDVAREASTRAWDYTKGDMKQDVERKELTKKRLGRSPDLPDSLVVAIEVAVRNGFVIATDQPVGVQKRRETGWLSKRVEKFKATRKDLVYA